MSRYEFLFEVQGHILNESDFSKCNGYEFT